MSNNLWATAVQLGTAALRPNRGNAPANTFQFYLASDTGDLSVARNNSGFVPLNGTAQATPTAKTADFTATMPELLTKIITVTSATAVAATLPTGAVTDAGFAAGGAPINASFEWNLINLGSASGAVTMTASTGHTYVGAAIVAIGTSTRFRTRKTAADTYVTYRLS